MSSLQELAAAAGEVVGACSPETRLLHLARLRQQVDAAMVAALAEVEASPAAVRLDGSVDGGQWLAARSELHPAEAGGLAALARELPDMPATGEALEAGRIGVEKARVIERAVSVSGFAEAEWSLVERVVGLSLRAARRVVGRFIADNRPPSVADAAANEVTLSPRRNGRWRLHGDLDAETAMVVSNELRRLATGHGDDEGLGLARRMALGLLDMARRSVTLGQRGIGSRPELVIVADASYDGQIVNARFEDGTPVSRQVFETLSCDATIRGLVMNGPSEPLELGRAARTGSVGQRRAAAVRDGGCVFPGCERPPDDCDLHHICHWTKHIGRTDLANLCLLCRAHHTLVHVMGFTFARRRGGHLVIYNADGSILAPRLPQAA